MDISAFTLYIFNHQMIHSLIYLYFLLFILFFFFFKLFLDLFIYLHKSSSKLICLHLPTDCFMKISLQSTGWFFSLFTYLFIFSYEIYSLLNILWRDTFNPCSTVYKRLTDKEYLLAEGICHIYYVSNLCSTYIIILITLKHTPLCCCF